jgi:hypothetical protein
MAQWNNNDNASNSVLWAVAQYNTRANTTTQTAFFGNTTVNAFVTGLTLGQYGVDTGEMRAVRTEGLARPAHAGWVVKKTGSGGRAGRVQYETIVAMGTITGDAENVSFPNYAIVINTQPLSASANSTNNQVATFTVNSTSVPTGATLSYKWQKYNSGSFANLSNAGAYSNTTTATLSVQANTASNGEIYRVMISATGADTIYSTNAVITITT